MLQEYLGNPAYYRYGPNNYPFLSTYSSGGHTASDISSFLSFYANELYFVPDFDETAGYYTDPTAWYNYWGDYVNGVFSWETAWPAGSTTASSVSTDSDVAVMSMIHDNSKTYMIRTKTPAKSVS